MAKRLVNQRALNAATRLITWSRWAAQSLESDYGIPATRISVIPPGVDCHLFRPREHEARRGRPRVLFVGGAFERKGGLVLLDAMRRLTGRAELDIVTGSDPFSSPPGLRVLLSYAPQPHSA